jgi:hypothetical protein
MEDVREGPGDVIKRQSPREVIASFPNQARNGKSLAPTPQNLSSGRTRRLAVALVLVLSFSGMLLATHKYVTARWNPLINLPQLREVFVVGREGFTTTDVNLRPDPSAANLPIGMAENGSRVKVLTIDNNWYEVQVMEHGRPKGDPFTSDRGWINKKYVRFD